MMFEINKDGTGKVIANSSALKEMVEVENSSFESDFDIVDRVREINSNLIKTTPIEEIIDEQEYVGESFVIDFENADAFFDELGMNEYDIVTLNNGNKRFQMRYVADESEDDGVETSTDDIVGLYTMFKLQGAEMLAKLK